MVIAALVNALPLNPQTLIQKHIQVRLPKIAALINSISNAAI